MRFDTKNYPTWQGSILSKNINYYRLFKKEYFTLMPSPEQEGLTKLLNWWQLNKYYLQAISMIKLTNITTKLYSKQYLHKNFWSLSGFVCFQ
jgi:hypothetical protein